MFERKASSNPLSRICGVTRQNEPGKIAHRSQSPTCVCSYSWIQCTDVTIHICQAIRLLILESQGNALQGGHVCETSIMVCC